MERVFRRLYALAHGGTARLRPYEEDCVSALARELGADHATAVATQLESLGVVQRFARDAQVNIFFRDASGIPRLPDLRESRRLGKVEIAKASWVVHARVYSHRGLLSSIEYSASPRPFVDGGYEIRVVQLGQHGGPPGS